MYYTEWSSYTPIAVVQSTSGQRWWFDSLNEESKEEALHLPVFDINRRRIVSDDGSRKHAFVMHRKTMKQ